MLKDSSRILIVFFFLSLPLISEAEIIDRVVAKINDHIVTFSEVNARARVILTNWQTMGFAQQPSEKDSQKRALNLIIEEKLLVDSGD